MEMPHGQATSAEESVKDLLSEASSQFSELMRKEVELAKTELKEQASRRSRRTSRWPGVRYPPERAVTVDQDRLWSTGPLGEQGSESERRTAGQEGRPSRCQLRQPRPSW